MRRATAKPEAPREYSHASDWYQRRYDSESRTKPRQFWRDGEQAMTWELIVRQNPKREDEGTTGYLQRIVALAEAADAGASEHRLPYKEPAEGRPVWATPGREPGSDDE